MTLTSAEREFHRRVAARCFNRAWDYLEKEKLDSKATGEMLNLAHASRFHWGVVGEARPKAVGDWQLARAYAAAGDSEMSMLFALSCLSQCKKEGLGDLIPSAMEGVARAYATAGDRRSAYKAISGAKELLEGLTLESEDRKIFESQIRETESLIRRIG